VVDVHEDLRQVTEADPTQIPLVVEEKKSSGHDQDVESGRSGSVVGDVIDTERYPKPTPEERSMLRKTADTIPYVSYGFCMVELAERASFYGVKTVFNNFMQFPLPEGGDGTGAVPKSNPDGHAGAL
jgi:POT family proton-dependent oligopeptide transporter